MQVGGGALGSLQGDMGHQAAAVSRLVQAHLRYTGDSPLTRVTLNVPTGQER